jgi:hypothetical protein
MSSADQLEARPIVAHMNSAGFEGLLASDGNSPSQGRPALYSPVRAGFSCASPYPSLHRNGSASASGRTSRGRAAPSRRPASPQWVAMQDDDLFPVIERLDVPQLDSWVDRAFQGPRPPLRAKCQHCLGQVFWTERSGQAYGWRCATCIPASRPDDRLTIVSTAPPAPHPDYADEN